MPDSNRNNKREIKSLFDKRLLRVGKAENLRGEGAGVKQNSREEEKRGEPRRGVRIENSEEKNAESFDGEKKKKVRYNPTKSETTSGLTCAKIENLFVGINMFGFLKKNCLKQEGI